MVTLGAQALGLVSTPLRRLKFENHLASSEFCDRIATTGIHSPDIPLASGSHWTSGHRVVAITPEGDTLQSYTPDLTSMKELTRMRQICHLDGRLIISAEDRDDSHLIALQGV